ncbi:amino acid ABC transporter permease [Hippea maritima]|uniref:Putative glutamine transport system permease protein GlnP n=1 Tax=Hippea maritima (strain ATCC 700847 / DSM 10411 / MH2) TaxID=760142 RepID=F2LTP5_HIPMA|nr:amino acid ABC transporter permease [Hippea maritima]AEA34421.1 polar amino acid ABC transporter, inner membrane subunit [Hippea maritima DSM 10411]
MDRKKKNILIWNLAFIGVIIGISFFIYKASLRVNYSWNWRAVPSYLVYKSQNEIDSPTNGFVEGYKDGAVIIKSTEGKLLRVKVKHPTVSKGAVVSIGDEVGYNSSYKAGPLLMGLYMTIKVSLLSIIMALVIGFIVGLMRISDNPLFKNLAIVYIELIRGTPLLVQIFIIYFFIGTIFSMTRFFAGAFALAVFEGAYIAEIIRAGIQSIPRGQTEAAVALGMNYYQVMRYIIMPQAIKRVLPALAGQFISLIKDSSLLSVISLTELTKAGKEIVSSTFSPFEVWFSVAALYFIVTYTLSLLDRYLERRLAGNE